MEKTIKIEKSNIQLILNDEKGRVTNLKPIFKELNNSDVGKISQSHYCVETNKLLRETSTQEKATFNMFQKDAFNKGFENNCFCFNITV